MAPKRRNDSIIPLSREHHYALLLCLRIHRGLEKHKSDDDWLLEQTRKTIRFFEISLVDHFRAEETVLFPAMSGMQSASELIGELLKEHQDLQQTINDLGELERSAESRRIETRLKYFGDLLETHIRKEERQLFPIYEKEITKETDAEIGREIFNRIGPAIQPKDPRLLI